MGGGGAGPRLGPGLTYEFLTAGDGDEFSVWIDGELRYVIAGADIGTDPQYRVIDISDLDVGYHFLTVALKTCGAANADVFVGDLEIVSLPEPAAAAILAAGLALLLRKRGKAQSRHLARKRQR